MMTIAESRALMGNPTAAQRARMSAESARLASWRKAVVAEANHMDAVAAGAQALADIQPALDGMKFDAASGCYVNEAGVSICMRTDGCKDDCTRTDSRPLADAIVRAVQDEAISDDGLATLLDVVLGAIEHRAAKRAAAEAPAKPTDEDSPPMAASEGTKTMNTRTKLDQKDVDQSFADLARARELRDQRALEAWKTTPATPNAPAPPPPAHLDTTDDATARLARARAERDRRAAAAGR